MHTQQSIKRNKKKNHRIDPIQTLPNIKKYSNETFPSKMIVRTMKHH